MSRVVRIGRRGQGQVSRGRGRGCGKERRKEGARGGEGGIMSARRMADINRDREAAGAGSGDTVYIQPDPGVVTLLCLRLMMGTTEDI